MTLTPSQQTAINCAVAKAMGYEISEWGVKAPCDQRMVARGILPVSAMLPNFCTSLDAAITLCDFLADKGWSAEMNRGEDDRVWWVMFGNDSSQAQASGESLPVALCEAFLRTMGIDCEVEG